MIFRGENDPLRPAISHSASHLQGLGSSPRQTGRVERTHEGQRGGRTSRLSPRQPPWGKLMPRLSQSTPKPKATVRKPDAVAKSFRPPSIIQAMNDPQLFQPFFPGELWKNEGGGRPADDRRRG